MEKQKALSRREFLKTALVGTAAAALLPPTTALNGLRAGKALPVRAAAAELTIITSGWPLTPMPTAEEIKADASRAGYAQALQTWLDANPGVTFKQVDVNIWDPQAIVTAVSGGTAPTYIFPTSLGGWSNAGARAAFVQDLMADLTPVVEKLGIKKKLTESARQAWEPIVNVDGKYFGYPVDSGSDMVMYRRDLLKAAGVEEPSADWTWGDLFKVAKALTSDKDKRKGIGISANGLGYMLNSHGYDLLSRVPNPKAGWHWLRDTSNPKWTALATTWRNLVFDDKAVYTDASYQTDNYTKAFVNGASGLMLTNVLAAFGPSSQADTMAAFAKKMNKPFDEVYGFRPVPHGDNGFFLNPRYVGSVSISPDTSKELIEKAVGAVDYMFLGKGWDIQKKGQYEATKDLQAVFNYPLPIDGRYTYDGIPGTFEDAWGKGTKADILKSADRAVAPDPALYFPNEKNPSPANQPFDDAWSNITYVKDNVDVADQLKKAMDTWNTQAQGFKSSVSEADFTAAAKKYYADVNAFWKTNAPQFYEKDFKPWYDSKVAPVLS